MEQPTIRTWHIVIAGFLQTEGLPVGMMRLWFDLHKAHASLDTAVLFREWDSDVKSLAERIWRFHRNDPTVCLYAYSWGGMSAILLARQLQRRGISVQWMVLSDPVYRHWYPLGNWRALVPWSKIVVPANVERVDWFRQRTNWPRGHRLVAADPNKTHISAPREVSNVAHAYMDDLIGFQDRCGAVAAQLTGGNS